MCKRAVIRSTKAILGAGSTRGADSESLRLPPKGSGLFCCGPATEIVRILRPRGSHRSRICFLADYVPHAGISDSAERHVGTHNWADSISRATQMKGQCVRRRQARSSECNAGHAQSLEATSGIRGASGARRLSPSYTPPPLQEGHSAVGHVLTQICLLMPKPS